MSKFGWIASRHGLDRQGLKPGMAHWNVRSGALIEEAVRRGEGHLSNQGALVVTTGRHTGRSVKDKFIVRNEASADTVFWGPINQPMEPDAFDSLHRDFLAHFDNREVFVSDLHAGASETDRISVRVVTETAWHALFARTMLIRPRDTELEDLDPAYTVLHAPSFRADPDRHGCRSETVVALDFERRIVLIGGTAFAGEIKKSVFSLLNFLLPAKGIMPMHCSANIGKKGDVAVFFGLSGTGKTTLSADPARRLIGDDEHGWSDEGVFNFEGGCYAKMINLSADAEPEIYAATRRFGAVLENVVLDPSSREVDLADSRHTENTRAAYPVEFIPNHHEPNRGGTPRTVIMLTADAFGVMPPIARLTPELAMYHFLSGYTAKLAGTEIGVTEPQATFSACFGAPFMPRHPSVYGALLKTRIHEAGVDCWLLNTGWTGGAYGVGRRMPIKATRTLLNAALDGSLKGVAMRRDPNFGFDVPIAVPGIASELLDPRGCWADPAEYDRKAAHLVGLFARNFAAFEDHVDEDIRRVALRAA